MIIYDIESYPNFFCLCAKSVNSGKRYEFEISTRRNDINQLIEFINLLRNQDLHMVGFNNVLYDYPVVHSSLNGGCHFTKTQEIIKGGFDNKYSHKIKNPYVTQIDLYLINHFDNMAKSTSLKQLEFVMRSENLQDLPYKPGEHLSDQAMTETLAYCHKDCDETEKFYHKCKREIDFRLGLEPSLLNANDTKIGEHTLIEKIGRWKFKNEDGSLKKTFRPTIDLNECIVPYIKFKNIELRKVVSFLREQTITSTKGVFKDLSAVIELSHNRPSFKVIFGSGGLHGCVEPSVIKSCDKYQIIDVDVVSYYPSLAISNNFYPEHVGPEFVKEYAALKSERKKYPKGTIENALYKLALNGAYGKSNSKYSALYDPKFTMNITINGQLLLCMLLENLLSINQVTAIQANTDGVTMLVRKTKIEAFMKVCAEWEKLTGLELERADYSAMYIRDVNNYIAVGNKVKRKGCYEYEKDFHQNHSSLVIPKVAELHMLYGVDIAQTIYEWKNLYDFMLFAKSTGTLHIGDQEIQRRSRYIITNTGGTLIKTTANGSVSKVQAEYLVTECNDMRTPRQFDINFDYYIEEVRKICL